MAEQSTDAQILQHWPSYAWALKIPEIKNILADSSITDKDEIASRIQATNWWKDTAPGLRQAQELKGQDPAAWSQQTQQKEADVWDLYNSVGLKPDVPAVQGLAQQALTLQWTSGQLKDAVVAQFSNHPEMRGQIGEIQTNAAALKQQAASYYVPLDDSTAQTWATAISAGEHKAEDYIPMLQQQAKSRFPTLSTYIDQGITPKDFFTPYQNEISKILEVQPDTIDLANSPKWSQVLSTADPKAAGGQRPMTISETQRLARSQPEWSKTQQANDQAATLGAAVLKTWGKVA